MRGSVSVCLCEWIRHTAAVPFPNSSSITRDREVAPFSAADIWFRSIMNADRPTDTDSRVWILTWVSGQALGVGGNVACLVKMCSIIPILAASAGTKLPMCARKTIRPTCALCAHHLTLSVCVCVCVCRPTCLR